MPYVVLTNDSGDPIYSRHVSEQTVADVANFLRGKLPFIRELKKFKQNYDIIRELLSGGGKRIDGNTYRSKGKKQR